MVSFFLFCRLFGDFDKRKKQYFKDFVRDVAHLSEATMEKFIHYENDEIVATRNLTEIQHKVRKNNTERML